MFDGVEFSSKIMKTQVRPTHLCLETRGRRDSYHEFKNIEYKGCTLWQMTCADGI